MRTPALLHILLATVLLTVAADAAAEAPMLNARIDHVILGAADLDRATDEFERLTGVRPVYGGKHPSGTHNALVSLGEHLYLEIIAVQPGASPPPQFPSLTNFANATPIGWAVAADDESKLRQVLTDSAFQLTTSNAGSRTTPAGTTLRWTTFGLSQEIADAPFFILWAPGVPHPATTSPKGCTMKGLLIAGPHAEELDRLVKTLGLPVELSKDPARAMTLALDCPKGPIRFEHTIQRSRPGA